MSHLAQEADDRACWQCGAPANPACAYVQGLIANPGRGLDGLGYPVEHGRMSDVVRVPVPRCAACQNRRFIYGALVAGGIVAGIVIGQSLLPERGFGLALGGVGGAWMAALALGMYEWRFDRRSPGTYPPLVRLRQAGWHEPD